MAVIIAVIMSVEHERRYMFFKRLVLRHLSLHQRKMQKAVDVAVYLDAVNNNSSRQSQE